MANTMMAIGLVLAAMAAAEGADMITELRDLHLRTVLVEEGKAKALIVCPDTQSYRAVADVIRGRVSELAKVELPVVSPEQLEEEEIQRHSLIVLGGAPDNAFTRRLVWERWVLDTWFPGDERYVVRTVHDPFGHGRNIVFLGGENAETVRKAADVFLARLEPAEPLAVGWIMAFEVEKRGSEVSADRIAQEEDKAKKAVGFKNGRGLISSAASFARQYYNTGRDGYAEIFKIYIRQHKALGEPGTGTHMNVYDTISMWDLIEESPVFSDEDRLFITNHLLYIMRSTEGANGSWFRRGTTTFGVRHNHQTLPGLACLFGGRYFQRGYALPEAAEWIQAGKALFDAQKLSFKPQCDCNFYEWGTLYQTAWWSLASGDYTFFDNNAYRMAAERALLEVDNRGWSAPNGDCWSLYYFPEILFKHVAEYYRDGRYEWILRKYAATRSRTPEQGGVANLVRGLEPKEPADLLGIRVAPMSPDFYNCHNTTMPKEPEPNIPIEQSFDKISFRAGFDPEDGYLLLDGIGMGSHGHVDVNGIAHYTDNDRIWLMDVSYAEAPNMRDHNVVTVLRNGETVKPPPLARLNGTADLETVGFCSTSLPGYCGTDWRRDIFWQKGRCFLVMDRLVALESADYMLRCHWRTPGDGKLSGATFTATQQQRKDGAATKKITRDDAEGGDCVKFIRSDGALGKKLQLVQGEWTLNIVGCGHHSSDDSLHVHLDGERIGYIAVSQDKILPSDPFTFTVAQTGEHLLHFTLREKTGTICDKVLLRGPGGEQITVDGLDLEAPELPRRIDTFTLECVGAERIELERDRDNVGKWFKEYPYADPVVNILQQSTSRKMAAGDVHCFANLFYCSNESAPIDVKMRRLQDGVVLLRDGDEISCAGVGPVTFTLGKTDVVVKAEQFILRATTAAVRQGTGIEWRGVLLDESVPINCERILTGPSAARKTDLEAAWAKASPAELVTSPRESMPAPVLPVAWKTALASAPQDVAGGTLGPDGRTGIAAGCADGRVRLLDASGRQLWEFAASKKVNSVAIADIDGDGTAEIIAGSDDRCCYVINADGTERWHYEGAAGDDPYWGRYWRGGEVEKVLCADIDGDGRQEVIFGAANMHVHACSPDGELLWRYRQYGICTSLCAADLTGNGAMNVIGGPASITCTSNCSVLDDKGKAVSKYGNDGWASALTAVCTVDLDGQGVPEVACGTNMNNVYVLNAADGKLERRWGFAAGDMVTSLCALTAVPGSPEQILIAGSRSEYVYALDADGKVLWRYNIGEAVAHVGAVQRSPEVADRLVVATATRILILTADGNVTAENCFSAPVTCIHTGDRLYVGCEDATVHCFGVR